MFKLVTFVCLAISATMGMDCSLGQSGDNVVQKFLHSCPRPLLDRDSESYCCYDGNNVSCCDLGDFVVAWFVLFWPWIVLGLLVFLVLSCLCCFLRNCCGF